MTDLYHVANNITHTFKRGADILFWQEPHEKILPVKTFEFIHLSFGKQRAVLDENRGMSNLVSIYKGSIQRIYLR